MWLTSAAWCVCCPLPKGRKLFCEVSRLWLSLLNSHHYSFMLENEQWEKWSQQEGVSLMLLGEFPSGSLTVSGRLLSPVQTNSSLYRRVLRHAWGTWVLTTVFLTELDVLDILHVSWCKWMIWSKHWDFNLQWCNASFLLKDHTNAFLHAQIAIKIWWVLSCHYSISSSIISSIPVTCRHLYFMFHCHGRAKWAVQKLM